MRHPFCCSIARLFLLSALGALYCNAQTPAYPFQDTRLTDTQRIDNLLSLLTVEEKIDLLGTTLDIPRLGIHGSGTVPTITGSDGQFEGLQGVAMNKTWSFKSPGAPGGDYGGKTPMPTTQAPQPNGLGQTWDPGLLQAFAAQEAYEARYIFQSYDRGGLILRAPNADLVRDPRWGRAEESYGEDPYLVGTLATAFVRGIQGSDPRYWTAVSMLKHFVANSNEDRREFSSSNFDETLLHDYYAKPFEMAIRGADAGSIMLSFNAVNGTPMAANPIVQTLVIKQWGFNGIIDTDRDAMQNLVTKHKAYPDLPHAAAAAVHAGVNDFLDVKYKPAVEDAVQQHLLTTVDLDTDLRGLLRALLKVGVLDGAGTNPYTNIRKSDVPVPWESQAAKDLALRATLESIVLLKNTPSAGKSVLPIDKSSIHSIAVLGPAADKVFGGGYVGLPPFAVTPLQGIQQAAGSGVNVQTAAEHDAAVALAHSSDMAIVFVGSDPNCNGEKFGNCSDPSNGREAIDRKQINLNPQQEQLVKDVYAANPRTVVVVVSGFPFAIPWEQENVPAILHMAHSSEQEGAGIAAVLFGDYNPGGHLTVTWPKSLDQLPPMMDYNLRDGRTYMYARNAPLYPFGFGLSYTQFSYSALHLSTSTLHGSGELTATVRVTNTGRRAGDDVVQLYVKRLNSTPLAPLEQLEAFQRVHLEAKESKIVELHLPAQQLASWNAATSREQLERGRVRVQVGDSSANLPLSADIAVVP